MLSLSSTNENKDEQENAVDREDYLKANRKLSREEEIKTHGRPVRIGGVHKSKKVYDRKRSKAEMKKALPYFLLVIQLAISASGIGRR